jgi:hypothetical protein
VPDACFDGCYTASLQSSTTAVSPARRCISTFFAIVQRSSDCRMTGGAFDRRRRERQASSRLYSLIFMRWYLPELHYYTAGMQDGCHFRHRVCRARNLTMLMGRQRQYQHLARCSPDILGNGNIIRFGTRYRQYSRYYKPGWPPQDIG